MKLFASKELKRAEDAQLDVLRSKQFEIADAIKEKLRVLNEIDADYSQKKQKKEHELADIEAKKRSTIANLAKEVEVLEERRRQALMPIDEEQNRLAVQQTEIAVALQRLETERLALAGEQQAFRERREEFSQWKTREEQSQVEIVDVLRRQRAESEKLLAEAKAISERVYSESEMHDIRMRELAEKERNVANAERLAKLAMIAADNRLAREQEEHRKVIEERKSLAAAIKEAKKHGVWLKTQ